MFIPLRRIFRDEIVRIKKKARSRSFTIQILSVLFASAEPCQQTFVMDLTCSLRIADVFQICLETKV